MPLLDGKTFTSHLDAVPAVVGVLPVSRQAAAETIGTNTWKFCSVVPKLAHEQDDYLNANASHDFDCASFLSIGTCFNHTIHARYSGIRDLLINIAHHTVE